MTVLGNGESLVDVVVPDDPWMLESRAQERTTQLIETLFSELDSDEITFDTTSDVVTFKHSNKAFNRILGTDIAEYTLADWVSLRFFEIDIAEIEYDLGELVLNGLHDKSRERLHI